MHNFTSENKVEIMKHYILLFIAILFEVIGTSTLKLSHQFTKPIPTLITLVTYFFAFYFLSLTLKSIPVGIAYAIWSGVGIVLISLAGFFLFQQKLDFPAILGMILIVVGVIVINLFSKSAPH